MDTGVNRKRGRSNATQNVAVAVTVQLRRTMQVVESRMSLNVLDSSRSLCAGWVDAKVGTDEACKLCKGKVDGTNLFEEERTQNHDQPDVTSGHQTRQTVWIPLKQPDLS
jgi:hypothetical protein